MLWGAAMIRDELLNCRLPVIKRKREHSQLIKLEWAIRLVFDLLKLVITNCIPLA